MSSEDFDPNMCELFPAEPRKSCGEENGG